MTVDDVNAAVSTGTRVLPYPSGILYTCDIVSGVVTPAPTFDVWETWYTTTDRTIAHTQIGGRVVVTEFIGRPTISRPGGPPQLWRSIVYGPGGWSRDYISKRDAMAGHATIVDILRWRLGMSLAVVGVVGCVLFVVVGSLAWLLFTGGAS